ncbi:MAG TPA: tRNA (adenosine(37)-N6)-dimethylallyltransferase MiaA [Ramlibacter sp.]
MPPRAPRAIALAGPTASGKTALSMAIARAWEAEIVSVDSALVYRGMDIGTAKPSREERARVPHHLLDIRDPRESYSAADFANDASLLISQINERGRLALLVGGTMLYFKALFEGLDAMPPANAEVRAQIELDATRRGWPALHEVLSLRDPVTAARLSPNDSQRIQRALEVLRTTGRPISSFHGQRLDDGTALDIPLFSLEPQDRAWLHERIAQRFDAMLAAGFLDEVKALRARGDLDASLPSMRCVGYRQAWEALDGAMPMDELHDRGIFATRQLAKRQLTWLRGMDRRVVIACDAPDAQAQLLAKVREVL